MKKHYIVRLSLTLFSLLSIAVAFPACTPNPATKPSSWSITLTTSGGFTGRGNGNILITSDGTINYTPPNKPSRPCHYQLSSEELRVITAAVSLSKPWGKPWAWTNVDLSTAAADAFEYHLELRTDDGKTINQIKWQDPTRDQLPDQLPEDLKTLREAVTTIMRATDTPCD